MKTILYTILFLTSIITIQSARFLAVFITPSYSHQIIFRAYVTELLKHNHEVVVITTSPIFHSINTSENLSVIYRQDKTGENWERKPAPPAINESIDSAKALNVLMNIVTNVFYNYLEIDDVTKIIEDHNNKFDALILEGWFRPSIAFAHKFKMPVLRIGSFSSIFSEYEVMGVYGHPILYPRLTAKKLKDHTFIDAITELYNSYVFTKMHNSLDGINDAKLRKYFGDEIPHLSEMTNNVDVLFVSMHRVWERNIPMPLSVVHVGDIHLNDEKELPKDLKSYLDSSVDGVIYISFGTNLDTSLLHGKPLNVLLNVFSRLPQRVLWKWNEAELPGRSKNIKISKWLPQATLLKHPNVKLFITQGGMQSTQEAISAGVPLLGMPLNVDQFFNTENYIHHNIGWKLDWKMLTEERLMVAINTLLEDERYRTNIQRLRNQISDQPLSPLHRAVWWTEYVLRHGGASQLRTPAANVRWSNYFELQLLLEILLVMTVLCCLLCTIFRRIMRYILHASKEMLTIFVKIKTV